MSGSIVQTRPQIGFAFESISVSTSAVGLTAATFKPSGAAIAAEAFITNEGAPCRYRYDGTDPTASVGHILPDGGWLRLKGEHQMQNFKIISDTGVTSTLSVTYERE